jgi:hypothetical protein
MLCASGRRLRGCDDERRIFEEFAVPAPGGPAHELYVREVSELGPRSLDQHRVGARGWFTCPVMKLSPGTVCCQESDRKRCRRRYV